MTKESRHRAFEMTYIIIYFIIIITYYAIRQPQHTTYYTLRQNTSDKR